MPKPHYTEAPATVRQHMERWRQETALALANGQSFNVQALGVEHWQTYAYSRGYDVRVEDIPTPAAERVAAFKGSPVELLQLKRTLAYELDYEQRCVRLAQSRRRWAAEPSELELAAQRRIERDKADADAALEQRTTEIANATEAKRLEKIKTTAREQAAKEIGSV